MSNYKLPRPPGEYRIGRYDAGDCLYLITEEAYTNWYKQKVNVRHSCIKNNGGLALADYPLSGTASYKACTVEHCPPEWKIQIAKELPEIYAQLWPKAVAKSEPTPDEYYVGQGITTANFYYIKRDARKAELSNTWVFGDIGTALGNLTNLKKFPQLGSEAKAKLQKLNPVRYREWEQFYMSKYPNFKPLREQDALKPTLTGNTLNPGSLYILYYSINSGILYLVDKAEYDTGKNGIKEHIISPGENPLRKDSRLNRASLTGCYDFPTAPPKIKEQLKKLNPEIHEQFEQYYAAQEQAKIAERYNMAGKTPDMFYICSIGDGWNLVEIEDIDLRPAEVSASLLLINPKDFSIREVSYLSIVAKYKFKDFEPKMRLEFQKLNGQLYGEWIHWERAQRLAKGSDFDIDKKAMKADYQDTLNKIDQERLQGLVKVYEYPITVDAYQGLKQPYGVGYDPIDRTISGLDYYNAIMNNPNSPGQDRYGQIIPKRRVGQSWANKAMREYRDLSTAMGWALQANQQNNSNLKQQNNETIIVCRKVKPVIRCKTIRGTATQSNRVEPAITTGHSINKSPIVFSSKGPGNRKICVSIK